MGPAMARRRSRRVVIGVSSFSLAGLGMLAFTHQLLMENTYRDSELPLPSRKEGRHDAVIIPGGGLTDGRPHPWVLARLDAALLHSADTDFFLVLSRGTTHKAPPLDAGGFPIDESAASAQYLIERGVDSSRVLLESWSLDTIGNAAFARLMHSDPREWMVR